MDRPKQKPRPEAKRKRGRPKGGTLCNDAMVDAYCVQMRRGMYEDDAAWAIGVHPRTIDNWRTLGEEGKEPYASYIHAIKKAQADGIGDALDRVREGLDGWQGSAWFLERRRHRQWAKASRPEDVQAVADTLRKITFSLKAPPPDDDGKTA